MAIKKIEDLSAASAMSTTDKFPVVQSTSPAKYATGTQLRTYIRASLSSASAALSYNNTTGVIDVASGYTLPTSTQVSGWLSAAVVTLNTLTSATQTFASGTTAQSNNWGIVSSGSTHTFHFPDSSATNRGLLTTTDWSTFNSKFSGVGGTLTGTSGSGYFGVLAQSSSPSTPASGVRVYANASNVFSVVSSVTSNPWSISGASITSSRTYKLPDEGGYYFMLNDTGVTNSIPYYATANRLNASTDYYLSSNTVYAGNSSSGTTGFATFSPSGYTAGMKFNTGTYSSNSLRWSMFKSNDVESGSNAGSDFQLRGYDDSGTLLGTYLTISRANGDTSIVGNFLLTTAAKQLKVKGGSATDFIGTAVLVGGTVTVANTNISTTDRILYVRSTTGGTPGHLSYTITNATSFTINSSSGTDTSTVAYFIVRQS